MKRWYSNNESARKKAIARTVGYRFGGNREKAIQRDGESCVKCGMTRMEHKEKFGKDITVDHIDGRGRYSGEKNNDLSNLQTLCLKCHGRKDGLRQPRKITWEDVRDIRLFYERGLRIFEIAKAYQMLDDGTVGRIVRHKRWKEV